MNDEWNGLTNGSGKPSPDFTIANVAAAVVELDALGSPPIAVKLNPDDIAAIQIALADHAATAVQTDHALPFGATMRLSSLPVYPDADVPRGEPRWVYAADEVPHG